MERKMHLGNNCSDDLQHVIKMSNTDCIKSFQCLCASQVATTLACDVDDVLIAVVCGGNIRLSIGGVNYKVSSDMMFVLYGGIKATNVKCSKAFKGYFMHVTAQYFATVNVNTADYIVADMVTSIAPVFELDSANANMLNILANHIITLSENKKLSLHNMVVTSLHQAYMYMIISVIGDKTLDDVSIRRSSSLMILKRFAELLKEHYMHERNVDYYAAQLGITSKYLSIVCRKYRGMTASRIIDGVVIRQAKMLLKQPGVSVQDVASQLNFPSQSFFGKYFKQHVGVSPSRYRGHE